MKKIYLAKSNLLLLTLVCCLFYIKQSNGATEKPTLFIENKGQVMDVSEKKRNDIKFTYCANGTKLFIANDGIYYQFMNAKTAQSIDLHRIDMKLVGASIPSEVVKGQKSEYFENYYLAGNAALNVHGYAKLTFKNIYPNIDWVIYTKEGVLEYDFIVHPGGNPNVIKINYSYADKIELTANGELAITSRLGKLIEGKPHSFSASSNDADRKSVV